MDSKRHHVRGSSFTFKIEQDQNGTFMASVVHEAKREQDDVGALYYVVAVIFIYGCSILMMIASYIRKNKTDRKLNRYLKEMAYLRKNEVQVQLCNAAAKAAATHGLAGTSQIDDVISGFSRHMTPRVPGEGLGRTGMIPGDRVCTRVEIPSTSTSDPDMALVPVSCETHLDPGLPRIPSSVQNSDQESDNEAFLTDDGDKSASPVGCRASGSENNQDGNGNPFNDETEMLLDASYFNADPAETETVEVQFRFSPEGGSGSRRGSQIAWKDFQVVSSV